MPKSNKEIFNMNFDKMKSNNSELSAKYSPNIVEESIKTHEINNNYNSFTNCTFNIVQLGNENLVEALSGQEQLKILNTVI